MILVGDNLEVMRSLPSDSADVAITSPPYCDARTYGIDFNLTGQGWVDWMIPRVVEACRIVNGLVFVNMSAPRRDWKYVPAVEWLVADLTRHHGIVCGPAPYVFFRIGIPGSGSGKYHRRDWEPVYAFGRPENCPPKWTDNTAMGHPPKWAPGGEMSNRLGDGTRVNQWGHGGDGPTAPARNADGSRQNGKRPSFVVVNGRDQWVGTPHGTGGEGRGKNGKHKNGTRRDADRIHTKKKADGSMEEQSYVVPVLADPGNVIQEEYTAEEVAELLAIYEGGDVTKHLVGGGVMGDRLCHDNEAPFPETLAEFFLLSFCPPGGTVLDFFSGSGTTCAVAKRYQRKWIGIDVRESQAAIARQRLDRVQPELFP